VPDAQPTEQRSFGRVIPSDEAQAQAGAGWAKRLGVREVAVASDDSGFGEVMRSAFDAQARALGIRVGNRVDGIFGGGAASRQRDTTVCLAILINPPLIYAAGARPPVGFTGPCGGMFRPKHGLMATDALLAPRALARLGPQDRRLLVTSAALDPAQLPPAGQRFARAFRQRFGRQPGRYAAYGYEAMAVVLDSIRRAGGSGDDRDSVIDAFFDTRDRHSVLGTYSIDEVGDTTLGRMSGYRVVGGRAVPAAELRVP
jgi:branched-chain amino acid transport system substrate-binding protein